MLEKPILINQQDYKIFYYVKDEKINEIFDVFISNKIELK
jgi:hypothetical protein